jgi:hypothetical protein
MLDAFDSITILLKNLVMNYSVEEKIDLNNTLLNLQGLVMLKWK